MNQPEMHTIPQDLVAINARGAAVVLGAIHPVIAQVLEEDTSESVSWVKG